MLEFFHIKFAIFSTNHLYIDRFLSEIALLEESFNLYNVQGYSIANKSETDFQKPKRTILNTFATLGPEETYRMAEGVVI